MQFTELCLFRGTDLGMQSTPHTFTNVDIDAWARMTGRGPSTFDLLVLARLEQAFWRYYHVGADEQPKSLTKQFAAIAEPNKNKLRKVNLGK